MAAPPPQLRAEWEALEETAVAVVAVSTLVVCWALLDPACGPTSSSVVIWSLVGRGDQMEMESGRRLQGGDLCFLFLFLFLFLSWIDDPQLAEWKALGDRGERVCG
jgi:hypothetical protein